MATLVIRKLDDEIKDRLRRRALTHGRSMAEEARAILDQALATKAPHRTGADLVQAFQDAFGPLGGLELDISSRSSFRELPRFEE